MAARRIEFSDIVASSLVRSQYEYYEMTGKNGFLEVAKSIPEKVLEVAAARSCYQALRGSGSYIIQEFAFSKFNETMKNAYRVTNARKFDGDTRRMDIVIKNSDGKIEAILEIKRKITVGGGFQSSDLSRLSDVKAYFKERSGANITALFAYPLTFNFSDQTELENDLDNERSYVKEIFGSKYSLVKGDYWIKFPDENFYFCFGAACGQV